MCRVVIFIALFSFFNLRSTNAQNSSFKGLFIGPEVGNQYLFGGAQVDGVETIGDGNRWIIGGTILYRNYLRRSILWGVEFQWNRPQGAFRNNANPDGTIVDYQIRPQTALQFTLGKELGQAKDCILMAYFAINQTRFNIDIHRPMGFFQQTDFENFGRVGLGFEQHFLERWSARFLVGTSMDALEGTKNGVDGKLSVLFSI